MKNKLFRILTGVAVLGAMAATTLQSTPSEAAPIHPPYDRNHPNSVNHRQARQQHRIYQGVRKGSLTYGETRRLEGRERGIARTESRDRRSGGRFTWRERRNVERRQNHLSRSIYRQKHDHQHH